MGNNAPAHGMTVAVLGRTTRAAAILVGTGEGVFLGGLEDGPLVRLEQVDFLGDSLDGSVFVG